ncbi:MAG TPA: hypothetical protein PKL13_05250 [bacterium]|nr:hypothetical protein [bacterium]
MDDKNEQNRITLSIAFIATYLAIIVGFYEKTKETTAELNFVNDIVFNVFIVSGIIISFIFFLYLVFTGLELNFKKEKEIIFEFEISKKGVIIAKQKLFNFGIRCIFISFTLPVYYMLFVLLKRYSPLIIFILFFIFMLLIHIILSIIFYDKNKNNNKKI